jgi:mono/diheme cytochrome c family protein
VVGGLPAAYPMPNYRNVLTDEEIAEIITFVRDGWNNSSPAVTAKAVAKIRKLTAQKTE